MLCRYGWFPVLFCETNGAAYQAELLMLIVGEVLSVEVLVLGTHPQGSFSPDVTSNVTSAPNEQPCGFFFVGEERRSGCCRLGSKRYRTRATFSDSTPICPAPPVYPPAGRTLPIPGRLSPIRALFSATGCVRHRPIYDIGAPDLFPDRHPRTMPSW
jgi:hypothetical protein